jgi:multiple sugar transport system substrate-binding protein
MKRITLTAAFTATLLAAAACGGGGPTGSDAAAARGPIKIWYSNNEQEVAWGKQMVDAWNAAHPKEKVTAQQIPEGKSSEEVIGAAITAGNAPCLIFNTAPAAVPQFQKQGGLVPLDDFEGATDYLEERTGERAEQYRSPDGKYYQLPWKSNPVMIFYNKEIFTKAGIDADNPPLQTYDEFLETARTIVEGGAADYAIWPSPTSEFFQPWFDFYPLFAAETGGDQLVEDGKATFASDEGKQVAAFWKSLYDEKLASRETYNGDAFGEGKSAMAIVGPWAIASYEDSVDWGVIPVPT